MANGNIKITFDDLDIEELANNLTKKILCNILIRLVPISITIFVVVIAIFWVGVNG